MTHEIEPGTEPTGGPQYDDDLPHAGQVPVYADVEQSLAPPWSRPITDYFPPGTLDIDVPTRWGDD